MEAAVLLGLGTVGYFLSRKEYAQPRQQNVTEQSNNNKQPHLGNVSSANTVYDSTHTRNVARAEKKAADAMSILATMPMEPVINRNVKRLPDLYSTPPMPRKVHSQLTGLDIPAEHFTHNNMTPFSRSDVIQNMSPLANAGILEHMTGAPSIGPKSKRELPNFFRNERNMGNINGTPMTLDTWHERMSRPMARRHEFPMPQVQVGPGLNNGFTDKPSDSYLDQREFAYPKNVDELRPANKPKETFEGRVLSGKGTEQTGMPGVINKNRPETFVARDISFYQPTTGAIIKETQRPEIEDRPDTQRASTTREYAGAAFAAHTKPKIAPIMSTQPKTQPLPAINPGPVAGAYIGQGMSDDKGKASIQVYSNSRDLTTTSTYQGNVTSLIKSITAPLMDSIKPNRGACPHVVYNPREDGNFKGPVRLRVYDPDDVAKTTIKEGLAQEEQERLNLRGPVRMPTHDPEDIARTTIRQTTMTHDSIPANLHGGPSRLPVYDPDNVLRTTIKETSLHESETLNYHRGGPSRLPVYDPDNRPPTTIKETVLQESDMLNYHRGGPSRLPVYDPDNLPPTTIKETVLQESDLLNYHRGGPSRLPVYDPDDLPRTTIKETLLQDDNAAGNVAPRERKTQVYEVDDTPRTTIRQTLSDMDGGALAVNVPKNIVYDPNDVAKTTIKQMHIDAEREAGNPDGLQRQRGAYLSTMYEAPQTQKETLADNEYCGQGHLDKGTGYKIAPTDLRPAAKADIVDIEYFGTASEQIAKKGTSTENYERARMNDQRELILEGRTPTSTSVKLTIGSSDMGERTSDRQILDNISPEQRSRPRATNLQNYADVSVPTVTHERQFYDDRQADEETRLQQTIDANMQQLHDNPYHIRVGKEEDLHTSVCDHIC